jgi:hypothetical protein
MSEGVFFPSSVYIFGFFYSILCWIRIQIRLRNRIQKKGKKFRFHSTADPEPEVTETGPRIRIRNIVFGWLLVKWIGGACINEVNLST